MRILGIDYGRRRIGLAISDIDEIIATPLDTLEITSLNEAVTKIAGICKVEQVNRIVVGLPLNMNGTKGELALEVESFADSLKTQVGVTVETWDERLTSRQAERLLIDADMTRARRKQVKDKLAAQLILQSYLDARSAQNRDETLQDSDIV